MKKGTSARISNLNDYLDSIPAALDSSRVFSANARDECSDEYCLDNHIDPPRFEYYKQVRKQSHPDIWDYDARQTMDELDFYLKMRLHEPPEERYRTGKEGWEWHPSNMNKQHDSFTGCNNLLCVPGCRFEAQYGRYEDSEVIAEVNGYIEYLKQNNLIIDIPLPDNWYELIRDNKT